MNLNTTYLGLELPHPFMPGASPMVDDLDHVKRLEDAGAAAIVMHSLFEEQVVNEEMVTTMGMAEHEESFAEAVTYMPYPDAFRLGPDEYLDHIRKVKLATSLPVIASLNGTTLGGWTRYAKLIEDAGADALELNVYRVPTDPTASGEDIDRALIGLTEAVHRATNLPLAVKLSPYHSNVANLALRLADAGAAALVVFNRHFQPDLDIEELKLLSAWHSDRNELMLRLRWLGILSGQVPQLQYACTGGVHTAADAIKALMCGATTVQLVTKLLTYGPEALSGIIQQVEDWLDQHEYESLAQLRGSMNIRRGPSPEMYTRAHYVKLLQSYEL